jgi:iron complex outermembrane recepter protein
MDDSKREDVIMHMDMPGWSMTSGAFAIIDINLGKNTLKIKPEFYWNKSYAEMTMYPEGEGAMFMLTWPDVRRNSTLATVHHGYTFKSKIGIKNSAQIEIQNNRIASDFGMKQLQAVGYSQEDIIQRTGLQLNSQLTYPIVKGQSASAKLAATQRIPTVSEQFGYYLFNSLDRYDYLGNPTLKNEQSLQLELAYAIQKKSLSLKIQAFAYSFQNYILGLNSDFDAMTIGALGVRSYTNIESAKVYGFELQCLVKLNSNWNISSQNSYTKGIDNSDRSLPLIPSAKSVNELQYKGEKLSGDIRLTHSAKQDNIAEYYGESNTDSYTLLDFNIAQDIRIAGATLNLELSVLNLMDKNYVDHLDWIKIPRMGRSFNASLKYRF